MPILKLGRLRAIALLGAAALLAAACTTIDLGPGGYTPPPIRTPQTLPQPDDGPGLPGADAAPDRPLPPLPQVDESDPNGHLATLTTLMDGANVVPMASTSAAGQVDILYNRKTLLLRWKAKWSDLSSPITGVAFYGPAWEGEAAPTIMSWPGPYRDRYEGRATLTPELEDSLLRGLWYVSVATEKYPSGEIRGQLEVVR